MLIKLQIVRSTHIGLRVLDAGFDGVANSQKQACRRTVKLAAQHTTHIAVGIDIDRPGRQIAAAAPPHKSVHMQVW